MADKQGWLYNIDTGLLIGQTIIQESPLEPGVWLYPPNATKTAPPAARPGFAIYFLDGEWEQREIIVPIPPVIDPRETMALDAFQFKAALFNAGLYNEVLDFIDIQPTLVRLYWVSSPAFFRLSPFVDILADGLGLSETDVDDIFTSEPVLQPFNSIGA